jgi:hypothetical protein
MKTEAWRFDEVVERNPDWTGIPTRGRYLRLLLNRLHNH